MPKSNRDPVRSLHTEAKRNAKRRGIEHSLTLHDVQSLVATANGRCQVTGIPFSDQVQCGTRPYRASLDRIESDQGYHLGNVRLVCVAVNTAMREWGDNVFSNLVNGVVQKILERLHVEEEGPPGRPGEVGGEEGR